jgi:histidyl-tRNA synthetase
MQPVVEAAPKLLDFLGTESLAHFKTLTDILQANGVAYTVNPRLVRGMDYYNLTVFEFTTDRLGSQGTVCAGGRYDYLFEQLGGKPAPAVGWALGVDRVLALARGAGLPNVGPHLDAYAIVTNPQDLPLVLSTLQRLRAAGVSVQMHTSTGEAMGSMKSQFKRADASGARFALIFGQDEIKANQVTVKPLRDAGAAQQLQSLTEVATWAVTLQSAA